MQKELKRNHFIVPTADLCFLWQRNRSLDFQWYFSMLKSFGVERVLMDRVPQKGAFSEELKKELTSHQIQTEHFITLEEWSQWENKLESLETGVHFIFLIYNPLTPDFLHEMVSMKRFLPQMKFVVIARKDWNFRNTFRSVPHFMRDNLHVDFPLSTYPSDPFYETHEIRAIVGQMSKDFRQSMMAPFCPNLRFLSDGMQSNIASISMPRKLTKNVPKISLITQDPNQLEKIKDLSILRSHGELFEILITRVAGEKTQVIPKITNVLTTRYWAHPIDKFSDVSFSYLNNFSASQADGEILFFIDKMTIEEISESLAALVKNPKSFETINGKGDLPIFKKDEFYKLGGLDPTFSDTAMVWTDLFYRISQNSPKEEHQVSDHVLGGFDLEKKINFELLTHKFVDSLDDFSTQIERNKKLAMNQSLKEKSESLPQYRWQWAKDISLTLYRSTPKVAMEGNLSFIYRFFYRIYRFLYHHYRLNIWRLNPKAYKSYWKLLYLPMKLRGILFKFSFPVRKIYYFLNYQYEKRILGLHKPQKLMRET